ncbi:MAG: diaminopimelate decarboxylase [Pseudobdellovibrionaceae bacterium]
MSKLEYNSNQELELDGVRLLSLVKEEQEGTYVYSRKGLMDRLFLFQSAIAKVLTQRFTVHYAMKANSHLEVLKLFKSQNCGVDIVSGGELKRALEAGFTGSQIIFSGVAKSKEEIRQCFKAQIRQFNVESPSELKRIAALAAQNPTGKKIPVVLRFNPDVDAKTHPYIATGFRENKFGMEEALIKDCLQILNVSPELSLIGVSFHIGSQLHDFAAFKEAVQKTKKLYQNLKSQGYPLTTLDVGGGLGIDYSKSAAVDLEFLEGYCQILKEEFANFEGQLQFEPGRYLVARSGVLLTQIQYIKKTSERNFILCNSGMNHLIRPALYEAEHRIMPLQNKSTGEDLVADVVGPVCESSDFLGKNRHLVGVNEGDWLCIADSGAYGAAMASQYNLFGFPREVVI